VLCEWRDSNPHGIRSHEILSLGPVGGIRR
jgi:hypothetical protein